MTTSSLIINGKDALAEWGIVPLSNLIGELLAPPPAKDPVKTPADSEHGSRFLPTRRPDYISFSRSHTRPQNKAASESDFWQSTIPDTRTGIGLAINIHRQAPGLVFKCVYLSCSQYSQYNGNVAKFILRPKRT